MSERRSWDRELGYERPQERWRCALRRAGRACCSEGPTPSGRCGGTHECRPAQRGGTWECMRSPVQGGPCERGPLPDGTCCRPVVPCQPRRSQRALRGSIARGAFTVAIALVALLLFGNHRRDWINPGDLSREHASLGIGASSCRACHPGSMDLPLIGAPELAALVAPPSSAAPDAAGACLGCHDLGEAPRSPHSLPPARLAELTAAKKPFDVRGARTPWQRAVTLSMSPEQRAEPACGTCHVEHEGAGSSVLAVDDRACGPCHEVQFRSFAEGHPELVGFPLTADRIGVEPRGRTRIAFDHSKHATVHFPEEDSDFRCVDCHDLDGAGRNMGVVGFDQACGSCHASDVTSGEIVLLALPNLDTRRLEPEELGSWPRTSRRKRPVELLHRSLLARDDLDPALAEALRSGEVNDSNDLSRVGSDAEEALAVELAWATKRLLHEIVSTDVPGNAELLAALSMTAEEPDPTLLAGLSQDLLGPAVAAWFPRLGDELALRRAIVGAARGADDGASEGSAEPSEGASEDASAEGAPPEAGDPGGTAPSAAEAARAELAALASAEPGEDGHWSARGAEGLTSGGWYRDDRSALIAYRPTGHADAVVAAWLDEVVRLDGDSEPVRNLGLTLLDATVGPGRCTKCHTIDGNAATAVVNWVGAGGDDEAGSFTIFRHAPHVTLLDDDDGCETCHSLDRTRLVSDEGLFEGRDPAPLTSRSSFLDVERSACASCHVADAAGDACTDCHRYHVGVDLMLSAPAALHATLGH